jgi:hypothetical protein
MKIIVLLTASLLYIRAGAVYAGSDQSFGGGVPKTLDGGIPKTLDGGVPKTLDWDNAKKPEWNIPEKPDRTKATEKQIVPAPGSPTNATANTGWQIGFRVDDIIKGKGFISRNQCRVNAYFNSLFFIIMTNTDNLAGGDWLGGLANEFRESAVMTNDNGQFRVIIPATQLRTIKPPKYDKY